GAAVLLSGPSKALDWVVRVRIGGYGPMIRSPPMLVVGLTGGIGAGKSTVSQLLASHGAVIVDADLIARQVVEPDGPAYQGVVDRFGKEVLQDDGTLDRAALAAIV